MNRPSRKAYVSPLKQDTVLPLQKHHLEHVAKILLDSVLKEMRNDAARSLSSETTSIPQGKSFSDSFKYRIHKSSIEIYSDWPWIQPFLDGTGGPFKMDWLTQEKGIGIVPLNVDGAVLFRMAPPASEAWIHPGVAKYNFINRGIEKGRKLAQQYIAEEALKEWIKTL